MQANFQQRISSSHCRMSSEFITTTQKPQTGTVYRFIRVPEINQNTNTVVLIKNSNPTSETNNSIAKVQKQIQTPPAKIITTTTTAPVTIDSSTTSSGGKKVKTRRDDIRRFQHNQIERARREKINNWIMVLGRIIDDNSDDDNTSNNNHNTTKNGGEALSKGGILEKACEYIRHLKSMMKSQQNYTTQDELENEVRRLSEENELLRNENSKLKRKYHIEGLNDDHDDEDEDFLLKRPKSESDDFKLDMAEFCDSLPGDDDITT